MISFTLATALAVRETGGVFLVTSGFVTFTSGTVVVAIRISLALKLLDYSRSRFPGQVMSSILCLGGILYQLGCQVLPGSRILRDPVTDPVTCPITGRATTFKHRD